MRQQVSTPTYSRHLYKIDQVGSPPTYSRQRLNSNSEVRNPKQIRMFEILNFVSDIWIWALFRITPDGGSAYRLIQNLVLRVYLHVSIIRSESGGQSWLQRNWRPIVMLSFLLLVVCDSFDLLAFRLADQAWMLLQIGLGGYVIGRSAEKIISGLINRGRNVAVGQLIDY